MRITLSRYVPIVFLGMLALGSLVFFAAPAHAAPPAQCAQKDCALNQIGAAARSNISGIEVPTACDFNAMRPASWNNATTDAVVSLFTSVECGFKAKEDGTIPGFAGANYTAGDTVKCRMDPTLRSYGTTGEGYSCIMNHQDGSYDSYYAEGLVSSGLYQHKYDQTGKEVDLNGGEEGSARVTGEGERTVEQVAGSAGDIVARAVSFIAYLILQIANFLLGIAGTLLNWVIVKTVFQFSTLIGNSPGLLIAWGILRDIGNMILLFGFIFMGLATILDLHTYTAKKALPGLIIFAVLMNFSLFAAEAVIDSSNVLTSVLYNQANTDACSGIESGNAAESVGGGQTQEDCAINYGIAGHIMQASGLSSMFAADNPDKGIEAAALVGMAAFATIGAVVLFAAAIMLVTRAVVLTFLMVFAPIGFAGMAIPPLQKMAKQWWNALIHQAFFAPILILLIFVSLKITDGLAGSGSRGSLAAALTQPGASVMGIIMVFVLVIGFMLASLIAAKKFGAYGADYAVGTATTFALGGTALGANYAVGGTARLARRLIQRTPVADTAAARMLTNGLLRPVENFNFDSRRIPGVSSALGMAGAGGAAKASDAVTLKAMGERVDKFKKGMKESKDKYNAEVEAVKVAQLGTSGATDLTPEERELLAKQSVKELEKMDGIKKGVEQLVKNLSPEQFEALMKSENLSGGEKGKIKTARYKALNTAATTGPAGGRVAAVKAITKNMSKSDLENVPPEMFSNQDFLDSLSDKQREDLAGSGKRTAAERAAVRDSSPQAKLERVFKGDLAAGIAPDPAAAAAMLNTLTAPQVGKLETSILTHRAVAQQLTPAMLIELQEAKKLNAGQIQSIAADIRAGGIAGSRTYIAPRGVGSAYWS